nr:polyprotein [Pigeon picornavirus B]
MVFARRVMPDFGAISVANVTLLFMISYRKGKHIPPVMYCKEHEKPECVIPEDMTTACSTYLRPCRRMIRCVNNGVHYMCRWHDISHRAYTRCGYAGPRRCCACHKQRFLEPQGAAMSMPATGNHTSESIATGGSSITTINYYGTNYAQSYAPNTQHTDPEAVASGVSSITGPMSTFMASPTVEELAGDTSDRLFQIIAGNSSLITQESAAGAVVAYGKLPCYLENEGNTVDLMTRPGPSCDRIYTLDSFDLTNTTPAVTIPLPGVLADKGVFGQNLQFHYLYRCGWMVHVQINATQFHAGAWLCAMVPECVVKGTNYDSTHFFEMNEQAGFVETQYHQLTLYPHQIINLRTTNAATVIVPYTNIAPASFYTCHNTWRLVIAPLVKLQSPPSYNGTVTCTVSVQPVCSQFNGLREKVVAQGVPTFDIPGSGQFCTTLANTGYPAFPMWTPSEEFPLPGRMTNLISVARIPTFLQGTDNNVYGFTVQNVIPSNQTLLYELDVSLLAVQMERTYIGRLARMFAFYRGSIVLRFTYTGPKQSSGKLLIAYTPPGGSRPATREEAMLGTSIIWDFGLQSTCTFVIPYISISSRRFANTTGTIFSYDGYVTVWYQTAVVFAPGCPTMAEVLVTAAAGEDLEYTGFMDTAYYQGLGDDLSGVIQSTITNAVSQSVGHLTSMPNHHHQEGSINPVNVGAVPALEAAETGVASVVGADVSCTIEPGATKLTKSSETFIPNMLSRYWYLNQLTLNNGVAGSSFDSGVIQLDLSPMGPNATVMSRLLKVLLSSATYWRFDLDLVIVPVHLVEGTQSVQYMVEFCPVGSFASSTSHGYDAKNKGANPKIFTTTDKPPASMRIPFMCPASYFCSAYDGFKTYSGENYGVCPSNSFGNLIIALPNGYGSQPKIKFYLYVRPVNIQAYMPRPLDQGNRNASTLSRGRLEVGDIENFTNAKPIVPVEEQGGDWNDELPLQYPEPNLSNEQVQMTVHYREFGRDFITPSMVCRFFFPRLGYGTNFSRPGGPYYRGYALRSPDWFERNAYVFQSLYTGVLELAHADVLVRWVDLEAVRQDIERFINSPHPLAGLMQNLVARLELNEMIYQQRIADILERAVDDSGSEDSEDDASDSGYCSLDSVGLSDLTSDSDFGSDIEYQGPIDIVANLAANIARPTIDVATDSMSEALDKAFNKAVRSVDQTIETHRRSWWKQVLGIVTKLVAVVTAITRSGGDPVILASMGAMLSVDLMNACPFEWAKQQVAQLMEVENIQEQGPSDWLKSFNSAITASKGLEWVVGKLWDLINWVREKLLPKAQARERDAAIVNNLVKHLREWRACQLNPHIYTPESISELAKAIIDIRDILEIRSPGHPVLRSIAPTVAACAKHLSNFKKRPHEPIGLLIHGAPGTGKSLATKLIGTKLAKNLGNMEPYFMPPDPKYFDGYAGQPVVVMDDLGQNPDGEDMKLLCQMISCAEFYTPQADLPDKGKPFTSSFVLASTNNMTLTPPTIAHPKALNRRFQLDLNIEVQQDYKVDGKLDIDKALAPCSHTSKSFGKCCPFICGRAVRFYDVKGRFVMTLDEVVIELQKIKTHKTDVSNKLDIYLQGPILKKVSQKGKKPPQEVLDLIKEDTNPSRPMLQYALDLGFEIPDELMDDFVYQQIDMTTTNWKNWAICGTMLVTLLTTLYFIWKSLPANPQGAYDGIIQKNLRVPEKRKIEVQGPDPDTQYALSLMKHNLFPISTATGEFTALGIQGKNFIIPKHAAVEPYLVAGKEITVDSEVELVNKGGCLELVMVSSSDLQDFRDLRPHMLDSFQPMSDCLLAVNSPKFPRTIVPVGKVHVYGSINLKLDTVKRVIYYHSPTKQGFCGGVILKAGKIIGMHIAGDGANGYASLLLANYFRIEPQGVKIDLGPAPRPCNVNKKTRLKPSVWHDKIKVTKQPAVLKDGDPRCTVQFSKHLFDKYRGNYEGQEPEELEIVIEQYAAQLQPLLPKDVHEPMTLQQVVEGYGRLDGLDLNTSPGYPYCTQGVTKRKLVANGYSKLIEGLDLHGYGLPYVTFLKDELRPIKKVEAGNTRLIECSSINDTCRMKMKFGRLFEALLCNNGVASGVAVGCDPEIDWTRFATELGDNVFAFDYKNFDASLSPMWFKALDKLLQRLGFDTEDLIIGLCNSTHIYENQLYRTVGGMPSGCSGTSIFNTIINNMILKTAALRAYRGLDLNSFKILAYGDDCIMSYAYPLDPEHIARTASMWGLQITPADKGEHFQPPGPIEGVTFLKRGFKKHPSTDILYHPIVDEDEIYQSLAWTKKPSETQNHILSLCHLIWHNGEESYNKFITLVRSEPVGRALQLPPYKLLEREWLDNFY